MISKSNYVAYKQCHRQYYLDQHKANLSKVNGSILRRMEQGKEIGELARSLFKNLVEVEYDSYKDTMIGDTLDLMKKEKICMAEASFLYDDLFCSVDILVKDNDQYDIYEVKSSTSIKKDYLKDIAFQYYILKQKGLKIRKTNLIYVNKTYVKDGPLDLDQFFIIEEITDKILPYVKKVPETVDRMRQLEEMPTFLPNSHCSECGYYDYCYKDLPSDSITHLYYYRKKKSQFLLGNKRFKDVLEHDSHLSELQLRQIDFHYHDRDALIKKTLLKRFLNEWEYPLYFLDFETLDYVIPKFNGVKVNQRLPYQASLHIVDNIDALSHKDILIEPSNDPRQEMCQFLTEEIGSHGSIVVYNASFEKSVIRDLMDQFPEYKDQLQAIDDRVVDLLDVFRNGLVYNKAMGGSFSIKQVYPALCPDKKNAYHDLEQVHNGIEAMSALESLNDLSGRALEKKKQALKAYCKLDTLSMVDIYNRLKDMLK
ncbi:DUF2779 domain-containing protein [Mycoplasmatota bacterium]|nr:DUF2779 domain-containing protein [Mycoplasmatota bacterium]